MPYTEDDARQVLLDRRGHLTKNIFTGTKLEFSNTSIASFILFSGKNVYSIKKKVEEMHGVVSGAGSAASGPIENFVHGIFNVDNLKSTLASFAPQGVAQQVDSFLSVLPGVASLQSGAMALYHLGQAGATAWQNYQVGEKTGSFRCGDPRAAIGAVREVLLREERVHESKAAINATHAAASAGGFFVDGGIFTGPASATLKTLATLAYRMYLLMRNIKEKKAGNKAMSDPTRINSDIFRKCPILGCYVLTEGSAFDILNFLVSEIGQMGWMDKVEALLPDMVYVQDLAAQLARKHDLQVSGLKTDMWQYRGMTRSERLKRWLKRKVGMKK